MISTSEPQGTHPLAALVATVVRPVRDRNGPLIVNRDRPILPARQADRFGADYFLRVANIHSERPKETSPCVALGCTTSVAVGSRAASHSPWGGVTMESLAP